MEQQRLKKNTGLPTPLYFFAKEIISIGYRNNLFGLLQLVLIQNIATTSLISACEGYFLQEVFFGNLIRKNGGAHYHLIQYVHQVDNFQQVLDNDGLKKNTQ